MLGLPPNDTDTQEAAEDTDIDSTDDVETSTNWFSEQLNLDEGQKERGIVIAD